MSFQAIKLLSPPVINIRGDSFLSVAWKERFFPSKFFATQRTWPRLKILANILLSLANNKDGLVLDNTTKILFFSFGNRGSSIMCMRLLFTRDSAKGVKKVCWGCVYYISQSHVRMRKLEMHVLRLPWKIVHEGNATLESSKYHYVINDSKHFLACFVQIKW